MALVRRANKPHALLGAAGSLWFATVLLTLLLVVLACNTPGNPTQPPVVKQEVDQSVLQTQMALDLKATLLAVQKSTLDAKENEMLPEEPLATQPPLEEAPTYTPYPTYTQPPADTPIPAATPTQDMAARIKAANVLVFEDVRGYYDLVPLVNQAVQNMNFSGGKVVNVGDAVGDLMRELNSPTRWDLIIISSEVRTGVRGEFWDMVSRQVDKNVALIAEVWYVDDTYYDKLDSLMGKCGIALHREWDRPANYEVLDYSIYWLQPDHPLFSAKYVVGPLITPTIYWMKDAGDLIKLGSGGDAQLLAGTQPSTSSSYGVLASCMEGRMVFQTFSTHDYRESQTVPLWENYILYTLTNHFIKIQ